MGDNTETIQPKSQATPLAEDTLGLIQGQIAQLGQGGFATDLQRQAGTAIQQFLGAQQGGPMGMDNPLIQALDQVFQQNLTSTAAQGREQFSGMGLRGSSSAGIGIQRALGEQGNQQNALLQNIIREQENLRQQNLLQGGQALQQFDINQLAPALALAPAGIFGEQTIQKPGIFQQVLQAVSGAAGGASSLIPGLGAGMDILGSVFGGGGGGPQITSQMAQATQPTGVRPPTQMVSPDTLGTVFGNQ